MMKMIIRPIAIWCTFIAAIAAGDGLFSGRIFIKEAQAMLGRPLTPVSVAGVELPAEPHGVLSAGRQSTLPPCRWDVRLSSLLKGRPCISVVGLIISRTAIST